MGGVPGGGWREELRANGGGGAGERTRDLSDYLGVLAGFRRKTERLWQERFLDGLESGANTLIHLSSPRSVPGGTPLQLSYLYKQS